MFEKKFHVSDSGSVEQCRKRNCNPKTTGKAHWAEAEHVRIHLDNQAYLAEIKAKVEAFDRISKSAVEIEHYQWEFSGDEHNDSVRRFREALDSYVAYHGIVPTYVRANLRFRLGHWRTNRHDIIFDINVTPTIDRETGIMSRFWTAKVTEHDGYQWDTRFRDKILHEVRVSFEDHKNFESNIEKIKVAYVIALQKSGKQGQSNLSDSEYEELAQTMIDKFFDVFDAVESVYRGQPHLWMELLRGDFRDTEDDKIVVDVNYDRSAFTGGTFLEFVQKAYQFNNCIIDADIRVTDEIPGHPRASWSLYRKDGIWSVATRTFDGYAEDNLTPTAENVRSHVYWHVMREVNKDNHELALKKADYAADVFTAVQGELDRRSTWAK